MENKINKMEQNQVAKMLNGHEALLGQEVAMKVLNLAKPMIKSVSEEISNMLGDNDKIIVIRKTKKDSSTSILILNTKEDFTIKGGENFSFTGKAHPENPKIPAAIINFYIVEEFVDMLLTGKMQEITSKLMK